MEGLAPVLWALLLSAKIASGANLSCFQCFKVTSMSQCLITECNRADRVCVSNTVIFTSRTKTKSLVIKGCAPRCPNTNSKYEWSLGNNIKSTILRTCCSTSLCNKAPTALEGPWASGPLLLHMGLSLLWALL